MCRELLLAGRWAAVLQLAEAACSAAPATRILNRRAPSHGYCSGRAEASSPEAAFCMHVQHNRNMPAASLLLRMTWRPGCAFPSGCGGKVSWQRLSCSAHRSQMSLACACWLDLITVWSAIIRSLALDLLRAAARRGADSAALKRCLAQAPPEQAMYLVLLHHHRENGNLRVRWLL